MAVEGALFSRLQATAGVTALVGSSPTRVYPEGNVPPQATLPYAVYRFLAGPRSHAMSADPGPHHSRVQVTSVSDDYDEARDLARAVEAALDRWSGTGDGTTVDTILVQNEGIDNYEPQAGEGRHEVIQDFMVHWR